MIAYKLDKPIESQKFIKDIDKLIKQSRIDNNSILLVKIVSVSYEDSELIPKLQYKNLDH